MSDLEDALLKGDSASATLGSARDLSAGASTSGGKGREPLCQRLISGESRGLAAVNVGE